MDKVKACSVKDALKWVEDEISDYCEDGMLIGPEIEAVEALLCIRNELNRHTEPENKIEGECTMDKKSEEIFNKLYDLHDRYDEDPKHMICAEAADHIKKLSEELEKLKAAPENKALTLEQLRQMDGEPVWVKEIDGTGCGEWTIIDIGAQTEMLKALSPDTGYKEYNYGKTWLAYARKPEGSKKS